MGGTNIANPMLLAFDMHPPEEFVSKGMYQKMVFILTDGETEDKEKCFNLMREQKHGDALIHTFGIGDDCDEQFCMEIAELGKGSCVTLKTTDISQLRSKVVETLSKSIQPSLTDVKTAFKSNLKTEPILTSKNAQGKGSNIYRNQLFTEFFIIDKKSFEESKELSYELSFIDPFTSKKVSIQVGKQDFQSLPQGSLISKIAAHYKIKELEKTN